MKNMTHATQCGTAVNVHIEQTLLLQLCYEHIDAMHIERLTLKAKPPRFVHTANQAFSDNASPISEEENDVDLPEESSHTTYQVIFLQHMQTLSRSKCQTDKINQEANAKPIKLKL